MDDGIAIRVNRTQVSDNLGGVEDSAFDANNRLTDRSLTVGGHTMAVHFTYDGSGRLATIERSYDGVAAPETVYAYSANQLASQMTTFASATVTLYSYTWDSAGQLTSRTMDGTTESYGYDGVGQVTNDNGSTLTYDATGNRTSGSSTVSTDNRLATDGTWTYTYDDAGRVVGKTDGTTTWAYTYDVGGQMVSASDGSVTVGYTYDVFGNRIARTQTDSSGTVTERYAVDGWDTAKPSLVGTENFDSWVDLVPDGSGGYTASMRRMFGAGFDDLLGRVDASGTVGWYTTDAQGSVRGTRRSSVAARVHAVAPRAEAKPMLRKALPAPSQSVFCTASTAPATPINWFES